MDDTIVKSFSLIMNHELHRDYQRYAAKKPVSLVATSNLVFLAAVKSLTQRKTKIRSCSLEKAGAVCSLSSSCKHLPLQQTKESKELLDLNAITMEEFEHKKQELLRL